MTTRTRALALDSGTSFAAGLLANATTRSHVKVAILGIFAERGPLTDDELIEQYETRSGSHPAVPRVTPQRVRSARAQLVRDGHVVDTGMLGFSTLGNRCSVWGIPQ